MNWAACNSSLRLSTLSLPDIDVVLLNSWYRPSHMRWKYWGSPCLDTITSGSVAMPRLLDCRASPTLIDALMRLSRMTLRYCARYYSSSVQWHFWCHVTWNTKFRFTLYNDVGPFTTWPPKSPVNFCHISFSHFTQSPFMPILRDNLSRDELKRSRLSR